MAQKKLKLIILLLLGWSSAVYSQESIVTSGGIASGSGGTVSYSLGQVVYSTSIGANGSVAQGVQQPYEISVVVGVESYPDIKLITSVYPNPTTHFLTLEVKGFNAQSISYTLYAMDGKLIASELLASNETTISMLHYASATYLLTIYDGNIEIKTFKIIKTR